MSIKKNQKNQGKKYKYDFDKFEFDFFVVIP